VRHRPALNHSEHHSLSHHAGRLSHAGAQQVKHPGVLAAHCQVPLSQDAREAKLEHLATPRQPLARRALGATDADRGTAGGSDRLPRGPRPRGILADTPRLSRCPQAKRAALFRLRALDREPIETWRRYEPLFHTYSTSAITPELLAALAQVQSTGNPVARTYWRWQLTRNPFAVYKPASSAVGMYQMTDAAYAEAARYCVRGNAVVGTDCGFIGLYTRAIPSHAIELAAVYLNHDVTAVLARAPDAAASLQHKQDPPHLSISAAQVPPRPSCTVVFR
jgi:hypothetical protein